MSLLSICYHAGTMSNYSYNNFALSDSSHDNLVMDIDEDDDDMDFFMINYIMEHKRKFIEKIPCKTSMLKGKACILEVLLGNLARCYENFQMSPHVSRNLCNQLKMMNLISDSRDVSVQKSVVMGLWILCHGIRQQIVVE